MSEDKKFIYKDLSKEKKSLAVQEVSEEKVTQNIKLQPIKLQEVFKKEKLERNYGFG